MSKVCSVKEKCGPTGRECRADNRECQNAAVKDGLEIVCDDTESQTYVYCPAGTQARDSGVVWILLVVAFLIAAVGSAVFFFALKKSPRQSSAD